MNISAPFIRRPVATSLLAAGLLAGGVLAARFLPIAPLPNVEFPTIFVSASLPGADPKTSASSLAAPLERQFANIAGVSEITSTSSSGGSTIILQFDLNRSIDGAARDVQAAINAAQNQLPPGMPNPPTYRKANPSDAPVMVLAVTSPAYRLSALYNFSYQLLAPKISQIPGVSQVDIGGGAKSAVRIQLNPAALASMGLTLDDIRSSVSSATANLPKGNLGGNGLGYTIASNDQLLHARDFTKLIVAKKPTGPVTLSSVGQAVESNENVRQIGWFNSERAVLLIIRKQAGANIIETTDAIRAALPQMREWLPPSVKLSILSDRTGTIRASLREMGISLLASIALVVMVCFVFLRRVAATLIAAITIPLSLAGTFGAMWLLGYSIDNLSLMALTVAVGFVVDDAIVVIETIVRELEGGLPPLEAAMAGARRIGFTVVSISVSLVAVFIPLLFMGGIIGRLFHEFAVTLSAAILISAVISLTLTPMLCSRFPSMAPPGGVLAGAMRLLERGLDATVFLYAASLGWVLRQRAFMLAVTLATLALTVWLYIDCPKGFFPVQDTGLISGNTEAGQDISFAAMAEKQRALTDIVLRDPSVAAVGSFLGGGGPGGGGSGGSNAGRMFISLKPLGERTESSMDVITRLRKAVRRVPGISLFLQPVQDIRVGGRPAKALYVYSLQSPSFDDLAAWAPRLIARLKEIPQLKDVSSDQQISGLQSNVVVDRNAAAKLGIRMSEIDSSLYSAFGQRQIANLYTTKDQYRVVIEADPGFQMSPASLDRIFLKSSGGSQIPLSAIARFETGNTPVSVPHQGQFPAISFSFNTAPGVSLGEAAALIEAAARDLRMPADIRGGLQGTAKAFTDSLSTQPLLILAAIVAVYLVLGILYESLIHPITILSTIPSAGLGALLALRIFDLALSVVSMIGIILLIGIVKKNAILMIDFAIDSSRRDGLPAAEAIRRACLVRFRPITMTTFAALFGALPLALARGDGAEIRQPLGVAIVGGLIVSQFLTLYTTPVIYVALDRFRRKAKAGGV
ncbi:MAG: efflux RND transporter permease subunit [Verrucomicrobiae bacterium]